MSASVAIRPAAPTDDAVVQLVASAGLPTAGLASAWRTWVAERDGQVIGTASLERHDDALLLRSVAVAAGLQGQGVGTRLVTTALTAASKVGPVALLTETAAGWFPRFGFTPVPRAALDPALGASAELRGACPDSAVAMLRP